MNLRDLIRMIRGGSGFTPEPIIIVGRYVDIWGTSTGYLQDWPGHGWFCHLDGKSESDRDWDHHQAASFAQDHKDLHHPDVVVSFQIAQAE